MSGCRECREAVLRELDRELSLDRALALDAHVAACRECAEFARRANHIDEALLRLAEPPEENVDVERNVRDVLRRIASDPRTTVGSRAMQWRRVAAVAALTLVTAGAWFAARWNRNESDVASTNSPTTSPITSPMASNDGAPPFDIEQRDELREPRDSQAIEREAAGIAAPRVATEVQIEGAAQAHSEQRDASSALAVDAHSDNDRDGERDGDGDSADRRSADVAATPTAFDVAAGGAEADIVDPNVANAAVDATRFDSARHEDARNALRAVLIQESAALPACANVEAARAFVARVDDSAPSNALAGWPMARLAASLFDDGEREVARAALRYVGLRGDRLTQFELERRADGDIEALLARVDSGDESSAALARACLDSKLGAQVRAALLAWPAARAAHVFETALALEGVDLAQRTIDEAKRSIDEAQRKHTLESLALCGESSIEPTLRLLHAHALGRDEAFAALATVPDIAARLAGVATTSRERFDVDVLAAALAHVRSFEALPWLENLARDPRRRATAVRTLIAYTTPEAFDALLGLWARGSIDATAIDEALAALQVVGPSAVARCGTLCAASGDPLRVSLFLDLLVASNDARDVPALTALAASADVALEERELAVDAVGDFGGVDDIPALVEVLRSLTARERRLAATVVAALYRLGATRAVELALAGAPRRHTERVLEILSHPSVGSVSLVQLARALEPLVGRDSLAANGDRP